MQSCIKKMHVSYQEPSVFFILFSPIYSLCLNCVFFAAFGVVSTPLI